MLRGDRLADVVEPDDQGVADATLADGVDELVGDAGIGANGPGGLLRNDAKRRLDFGERGLDLEPRLEGAPLAPDLIEVGVDVPPAGQCAIKQTKRHGDFLSISQRSG